MNTKHTKIDEQKTCFSEQNFGKVFTYVSQHPDLAKQGFVAMEGFEIAIVDTECLFFKKEGYSMGMALKNKGIIALAKGPDNDRNKKAIEQAFCLLLETVPQAKTWLLIGVIFSIVTTWLWLSSKVGEVNV